MTNFGDKEPTSTENSIESSIRTSEEGSLDELGNGVIHIVNL